MTWDWYRSCVHQRETTFLSQENDLEHGGFMAADITPPGWSYNPSDWSQRLPLVGLALVGFAIAGYLALYQWGIFIEVWDPFFPGGSERILHSSLSQLLPIPDAALGAIGYLLDAVSGAVGGRARWRTMPWIVILFGVAVGPLGFVSVLLVIAQPVLFDAWCTLCLASALISIALIGPAMDEVLVSLQYLKSETTKGNSWWHALRGNCQMRTA
jgi:hypothetical protein